MCNFQDYSTTQAMKNKYISNYKNIQNTYRGLKTHHLEPPVIFIPFREHGPNTSPRLEPLIFSGGLLVKMTVNQVV